MTKAADKRVPTTMAENEISSVGRFGGALFDIGWRLAATVVIFLWGGSTLDKWLGSAPWFALLGFVLVIVSFVLIVRQVLQKIPRELGGLKK